MNFAKIDSNNIVIDIITADQDFIDGLEDTSSWLEYGSTRESRKNDAGIGSNYDSVRDAFLYPQPFPSWVFNEETCVWDSPVSRPAIDGKSYFWDEENTEWKEQEL